MKDKQREKIIQALAGLVRDEAAEMNKLRLRKRITQLAGWLALILAFTLAFQDSESPLAWLYTLGAALGGVLLGLNIWFEKSLLSWPVLREFLDRDRLRDARVDDEK